MPKFETGVIQPRKKKKVEETKPVAKTPLTIEQKKAILLKHCKTKQELKNWIKYHLGLELPDQTVSRYADTNPLDVIWELYDICVNKNNPENVEELLYVASRGSGKCSILNTFILTDNGLKYIQNIKVGDTVYTGWGWDKVKMTFDEGTKKSIRLKTRLLSKETPSDIVGTPHHRIQAILEDGSVGWATLDSLQKDQYVYKTSFCDFQIDIDSKEYVDGWIVGVIAGDGHISEKNRITLTSADFEQCRYYADEVYKRFGKKFNVYRKSKKAIDLGVSNVNYSFFLYKYLEGRLCYDKKLKTLEHSPNFLAGFISGLMDTDGSKDEICLANKELIYQIGHILNMFGVITAIDNHRKKPRFSMIKDGMVSYHSCLFKSKLPHFLWPKFAKRQAFKNFSEKMNEQFRYPAEITKPFIKFMNEKLNRKNGYITVDGETFRKTVPFSKSLVDYASGKYKYVEHTKLKALREFFQEFHLYDQVDQLDFILNGYFEQVDTIEQTTGHMYDLEMENIHSYWSNGFISHNTLAVAIAELMILLHDQRDVVHVGAILSQAKRCYAYQLGFMLNDKLRPVLEHKNTDGIPLQENANMEKSMFNLIDRYSGEGVKTTIEIIPCTLKACVVSDTYIKILNGTKQASEISIGDMLLSGSGNYIKVIDNSLIEQECIRIELDDGRVLEGTLDHKIWTDKGWIELQNLCEDHEILG